MSAAPDYWQEGYDARLADKPRDSNPYPHRKAAISGPAWFQGWDSANRSIELGYIRRSSGDQS